MADAKQDTRSASQIEADIDVKRERLAGTVDQLTVKAHPKAIAKRGADAAQAKLNEAVYTPEGDLRGDRISALLATASALLFGVGLIRRRRG